MRSLLFVLFFGLVLGSSLLRCPVDLDGSSNLILGKGQSFGSKWSLSAWVQQADGNDGWIYSQYSEEINADIFSLFSQGSDDTLSLQTSFEGATTRTTFNLGDTPIDDGQWHYISLNYHAGDQLIVLVVDGKVVISENLILDIDRTKTSEVTIGKDDGFNFVGKISDIKVGSFVKLEKIQFRMEDGPTQCEAKKIQKSAERFSMVAVSNEKTSLNNVLPPANRIFGHAAVKVHIQEEDAQKEAVDAAKVVLVEKPEENAHEEQLAEPEDEKHISAEVALNNSHDEQTANKEVLAEMARKNSHSIKKYAINKTVIVAASVFGVALLAFAGLMIHRSRASEYEIIH